MLWSEWSEMLGWSGLWAAYSARSPLRSRSTTSRFALCSRSIFFCHAPSTLHSTAPDFRPAPLRFLLRSCSGYDLKVLNSIKFWESYFALWWCHNHDHSITKNSSGDEIANANFLYDDIVLQNKIDWCINSATDRRGYVLERNNMFTKIQSNKVMQRPLRRSRSFKITDFWYQSKAHGLWLPITD